MGTYIEDDQVQDDEDYVDHHGEDVFQLAHNCFGVLQLECKMLALL